MAEGDIATHIAQAATARRNTRILIKSLINTNIRIAAEKRIFALVNPKKERMNPYKTTAIAVASLALAAMAPAETMAQKTGSLKVEFMSTSLDSLITHCQRSNYNQTQIDGFRVQIYSGSGIKSKEEASEAQARFVKSYPDQKAYLIYNAPFWRVRVGDFRSRSEALALLQRVKGSFGGSYVVRDNTVRKKNFRQ